MRPDKFLKEVLYIWLLDAVFNLVQGEAKYVGNFLITEFSKVSQATDSNLACSVCRNVMVFSLKKKSPVSQAPVNC